MSLDYVDRNVARAERKFDAGRNHFWARSAMSVLALRVKGVDAEPTYERDMINEVHDNIVISLGKRGADAIVYSSDMDQGGGDSHTIDRVLVLGRDGEPVLSVPDLRSIKVWAQTPSARDLLIPLGITEVQ